MKMHSVLITGASGFVGKPLCLQMIRQGYSVRAAIRSSTLPIENVEVVPVGTISATTDWSVALATIDTVIHLAARVHVMNDYALDPLDEFRKVNVDGTLNLARQAATAGVKRFIFISSVKVNGERTEIGEPFTEVNQPNPQDAYGISKLEAEQGLLKIAQETGMKVVIVRPPLVYGAGVKGNFAQMIKVLASGIPLPFASVKNLRSYVYVENLVDALILCATHPKAAGQTYFVSDGEDISTPDLLHKLSSAMGQHVRLLPCSPIFMRLAGRLFGMSDKVERLLGSLQVDSTKIRRELGWQPPFTLDQGLRVTVIEKR